MKKIIVIGAGAAGCMAAGTAAQMGNEVLLFDKNARIARKILVTGKGRCNITNNCDNDTFLKNIPVNNRFLYSAISAFSTSDAMEFFERLGLPLKTERGNRVFPQSDKAMDVVDTLHKFLKENKVKIISETVTEVLTNDGQATGVKTGNGTYKADSVVIATGGLSYPKTGSTGDGYKFAKDLGHTIIKTSPSLTAVEGDRKLCKEMQGLALKNVKVSLFENDKVIFEDFGEMLFTHFGMSGPMILSASAHIRNLDTKKYYVKIDLKPALDVQSLDKRILSDFAENMNKDFYNALDKLLPRKIIMPVINQSKINKDTKVNVINKKQREEFLKVLKGFKVEIDAMRPIDEAIITTGGVSTKEISPKTMESKVVKGLYFAGEVIDVDAYTGGFNLQIAWSTAYLAGINV